MTQSKKTLHGVVAMAAAIVVTLATDDSWAGPRAWINKTKEKAEKVKEGVEAVKTLDAFSQYKDQFIAGSGLIDLWGRSFPHFLMIWLLTITLTLILYRWKKNKATSASLWMKFFVAYAIGIGGGWTFELFRSFSHGGSEYTSLLTFTGLLMVGSLLLYLPEFLKFIQAIRKKEVPYFLRTWELPPWVTGEAVAPTQADEAEPPEGTEDDEPADTAESQTEAPASDEAPAPQPTGSSEPANWGNCPHCHQRVRPNARFCGHCAKPLYKAPEASVSCPSCGKVTSPRAKFCGHCRAQIGGPKPVSSSPRKPSEVLGFQAGDDTY